MRMQIRARCEVLTDDCAASCLSTWADVYSRLLRQNAPEKRWHRALHASKQLQNGKAFDSNCASQVGLVSEREESPALEVRPQAKQVRSGLRVHRTACADQSSHPLSNFGLGNQSKALEEQVQLFPECRHSSTLAWLTCCRLSPWLPACPRNA